MSSNLYWRPVPVPPREGDLPFALKKVLARKLWDHDGSLSSDPAELDRDDPALVGYLQGLRDAAVEGADVLLAAVQEHGRVEVWISS